jgi:hypothetical protein
MRLPWRGRRLKLSKAAGAHNNANSRAQQNDGFGAETGRS